MLQLLLRQQPCVNLPDTYQTRNSLRRVFPIAGEHDGFDALLPELPYRRFRTGFYRIADHQITLVHAVHRYMNFSPAFPGIYKNNASLLQQPCTAAKHVISL